MTSPSSGLTTSGSTTKVDVPLPVNRHALTPHERQREQLAKLLKDPSKPVFIPPPPKEKTIRPAREMMKNVQGSSAGAGSGEFHVYKANRRREYERLKLMEEQARKETEAEEFERKRKEREALTEAKTMKNRAKRTKKKERAKGKGNQGAAAESTASTRKDGDEDEDAPTQKKRRLVNGSEMVFRLRDESSDDNDEDGPSATQDDDQAQHNGEGVHQAEESVVETATTTPVPIVEQKITIYDSD